MSLGLALPVFAYNIQDISDTPVLNDFVLGPGKIEIFADPGDEANRELLITNRMGKTMNFRVEIEDFRGSRDNPEAAVVLMGQEKGPYSLKDYIKPEIMDFSLGHGQRMTLPIKISIPQDAEPGGLYGSVIITTSDPKSDLKSEQGKATGQMKIVTRLGALFFVRVSGDVKESGFVKDFTLKNNQKFYEQAPVFFNVLFQNDSSVHLQPYGTIEIKNFFGKKIDEVKLDPWFIMPDSIRTRGVQWDKKMLFGRYTATLAVNRGYQNIIDQKSVVFWVIPWKIVLAGLVILFVIAWLLRWTIGSFEIRRKTA